MPKKGLKQGWNAPITVYGIDTIPGDFSDKKVRRVGTLRLPFTVLILLYTVSIFILSSCWNAPITVYGIDTLLHIHGRADLCWLERSDYRLRY